MRASPYSSLALTLTFLLLGTSTTANRLFERLSFGHLTPIAPDGKTLPNWTILGSDPEPEIYSDRVSLTPAYPGNKRGGLWTNEALTSPTWDLQVEFRASGPERGGGNLQLWLLKNKTPETDLGSVYTVERFEGLGLILDQWGGQGGSVRGFLNDGYTNYRARQNIDGLAFGQCYYPYRNLGMMSRLRLLQTDTLFQVSVDDEPCFQSNDIKIPSGYYFGVTAASAENPDAFEVTRFVVTDGIPDIPNAEQIAKMAANAPRHQDKSDPLPLPDKPPPFDPGNGHPPPQASPAHPHDSTTMDPVTVGEVLSQLLWIADKIDFLHQEVAAIEKRLTDRHEEIKSGMKSNMPGMPSTPSDQLNAMARRIEHIEGTVQKTQRDIEGRDYMDHLKALHDTLEKTQEYLGTSLHENMTKTPRLGFFLFIIIAFQILLAAGYVFYKRKRANSPKKFL